jgi:hypothetical protein
LLDRVVAQPAVELTSKDCPGVGAAELGEGLDVDGELESGPQACLSVGDAATFEEMPEPGFSRLHGRFAQATALEKVKVLLGHGRKKQFAPGPSRQ